MMVDNLMMVNNLLRMLVSQMELSGKDRTASAYQSAVHSVLTVLGPDASGLELFTPEALRLYQERLIRKGLSKNTVSFYMRMLRAIYNKGVLLGFYPDAPHLFEHVYTGVDSTPKRAVSPRIFGKLQRLDLSCKPNLEFSRDLFLLSFVLQGISFVDLAFLRKSDIHGSVLTYHRAKTGSVICVPVPEIARCIISRYASQTKGSVYLLPVITDSSDDVKLQYRSALRTHNRRLKKLAQLAGIEENLTSYVARHSWATTARDQEVPIGIISQAMGHRTEEVTHIYLADFDQTRLLQANQKVLTAAHLNLTKDMRRKSSYISKQKNVSHYRSERHF